MPVAEQKRSCLAMISTPGDETNHYTELRHKTDSTGRPIFRSLEITHLCDDCRKLPPEKAVYCNHW